MTETDPVLVLVIEATRTDDPEKLQQIADDLRKLGAGDDAIGAVLSKKKECEIEIAWRERKGSKE